MDNFRQTVASVRPGRTVKRTVSPGEPLPGPGNEDLRIATVRAVPADEAPVSPGVCPPAGTRVMADEGDAAMGLRVVGLHLTNCGTGVYHITGFPHLRLLDDKRKPVDSVRILHGTDQISTAVTEDARPQAVTLQPGESASASLAWRNTTGSGSPVNAPYAEVTAKPGSPTVTVTPEIDLGTTGELGVSPWKKDQAPVPSKP
ncbi:DUF4232 domain-containing protein [Streptomyces sp. NBC_00344]|uniref:DUF4232 domain-containing protein n=1 Tax=Streptomyces sp. NBC_00344 TaxID=2975720 RepID=UPI002E1A2C93